MAELTLEDPARRDFLYLATGAIGVVAAAGAIWPLINQMEPDASTLAQATTEVDLTNIAEGQIVTIKWQGKPVFVRHRTAKEIADAAGIPTAKWERFEDAEAGGFFATAADEPSLVLRLKDDYDGAEPSGNSIAILNLLRLARITGRKDFEDTAARALAAFAPRLSEAPEAMPQMLAALEYRRSKPVQIVLAGTRDAIEPFLAELRRRFLPFATVLLAAHAPVPYPPGPAAAYVCENFSCRLPATGPHEFAQSLDAARTAAG